MTSLDRPLVTLAVIAKEPVPGRVKTRLCPPCSPEQAAAIALASLRDSLDAVAAASERSGAHRRVVVLEGRPGDWIPDGFDVIPQRGDGLDERLAAAVHDVDGPIVIIGMDTPQVTPDLILEAVDALCSEDCDAVLGMADDGGYWVIGLRDVRPDALVGVPMSTDTTGAEQLRRLTDLGLRTTVIGSLCDVDTFAEALSVSRLVPQSRFARAVAAVAPVAVVDTAQDTTDPADQPVPATTGAGRHV